MCTVKVLAACVVPAATDTVPQLSVPLPLIPHEPPQPMPWLAIVHERPAFTGSTSVRLTPFASAVPLLKTVRVNPICWPTFTCAASAVFTVWIKGATHVDAVD